MQRDFLENASQAVKQETFWSDYRGQSEGRKQPVAVVLPL